MTTWPGFSIPGSSWQSYAYPPWPVPQWGWSTLQSPLWCSCQGSGFSGRWPPAPGAAGWWSESSVVVASSSESRPQHWTRPAGSGGISRCLQTHRMVGDFKRTLGVNSMTWRTMSTGHDMSGTHKIVMIWRNSFIKMFHACVTTDHLTTLSTDED